MRFKVGCTLGYHAHSPGSIVLNIRAARTGQEVLRESLRAAPETPVESYTMPESGNRYDRLKLAPGPVQITYEAEVAVALDRRDPGGIGQTPAALLPFEVLPHLYPSRYCQAERLVRHANQLFGGIRPGHERVTAICNWINDEVLYERGTSSETTSAMDTIVDRAGVCRDFAHLGIAFCRSLGVPARFMSCYALGLVPPDFHAVFEAWLDGRWYRFDATRQAALDGLVRIGVGRDAAEVSFATMDGELEPTAMSVVIDTLEGWDPDAERPIAAISIDD